MKHAIKTLGFCAGERYRQIVLKCLDGGFASIENGDAMGSKLQLRFMKEVVDVLRDESEHLQVLITSFTRRVGMGTPRSWIAKL